MTYLYETIPATPDEPVSQFEIQQSIHDDALTHHPETGQPIRRVILGGWGLVRSKGADRFSAGSSSGSCCGGTGCC